MRVSMIGLGLIGGSIARIVAAAGHEVAAWTPTGRGPDAAHSDGVRAAASLGDAVAGADLVVIAAPPLPALEIVDALAATGSGLEPATVVTDVVSTKVEITQRARATGLRFVGGHPLAGRETTGYAAADPTLFRDRPWVIVPPEPPDDDAVSAVRKLVRLCGARPVELTAGEHDRAVAGISHLPLVVSAALVEAVAGGADWAAARSLAAGGWAGMTRLARGDVEMGTGILVTNRSEVAARLRDLAAVLAAWSDGLSGDDRATDRIRERLTAARATLAEVPE